MLGRGSNQKTFFDEVLDKHLPKNHFLKVNDIANWTPIEKGLKAYTILQTDVQVIRPLSSLRPCFCSSGSTYPLEICRKPSQTGCHFKAF